MKKNLSLLFLLCAGNIVLLAEQSEQGDWQSFFSYINTTRVEETPSKIFGTSDGCLFSVNKEDHTLYTYTKQDGLASNTVQLMAYGTSCEKLLLVYTDANMDVLDIQGNVYNIPDLYEKTATYNKTAYQAYFLKDRVYVSCGFGIVALNLKRMEVQDTYIIGEEAARKPVYGFCADGTDFYALMDDKIRHAPMHGANLLDYTTWQHNPIPLPHTGNFRDLLLWQGDLLLVEEEGDVYRYRDGAWSHFYYNTDHLPIHIRLSGDKLMLSNQNSLHVYSESGEIYEQENDVFMDAVESGGAYWAASARNGLTENRAGNPIQSYCPAGARLNFAQRMCAGMYGLWVAPGYSWADRGWRMGCLMHFQDRQWSSWEEGARAISPDGVFCDVVSIAVDPQNPMHVFAATWGEGVYEFLDGKAIQLYNKESTGGILQDVGGYGPHYVRVDGLAFDSKGNLWVLNTGVLPFVKYRSSDGVWHQVSLPYQGTNTLFQKTLIHSNGQKWLLSVRGTPCVMVWDDGGTLEDTSDDRFCMFSVFTDKDGNNISPQCLYDIVEDKEGTVWVASSEGPILMTSPSKVFDSNYRCTRVKIPRNDGSGLADYLLDGVVIRSIAVDGANRKWIATESSGVYLVSADGISTIHHFDKENSPMSTNTVTCLSVLPTTGQVMMATSDGLMSYRSDATEPVEQFGDRPIRVIPNPVRPDYTGSIMIDGLEANTLVKITDSAGNVVFEGTSTGGSIVWNGKNGHGSYVAGGVYVAHCMNSDEENSRSVAIKFLIVR